MHNFERLKELLSGQNRLSPALILSKGEQEALAKAVEDLEQCNRVLDGNSTFTHEGTPVARDLIAMVEVETIARAFDFIRKGNRTIWSHFGVDSPGYNVMDMRECPWAQSNSRVFWWDNLDQYNECKKEDEPDEVEIMYSGTTTRDPSWTTSEYTMVLLNDGRGNKDAYLFTNANKVSKQ